MFIEERIGEKEKMTQNKDPFSEGFFVLLDIYGCIFNKQQVYL
jgi:hypothetical protein